MITQLALTVAGEQAEAVGQLLEAAGALAVRFEEGQGPALYDEGLAAEPRYWPRTAVIAFFAEPESADFAEYALADFAPVAARSMVAEEGWEREALKNWQPIAIGDGFWIYPSWIEPPDDRFAVIVDPGLAFGTGSHPTTRLCLRWLQEDVPVHRPARLLDVGCGSGILAIAALRLGAGRARGIDIDPLALDASAANAALNGVADRLVLSGDAGSERYDRVIANILARPLLALQPALTAAVAPGGRLLLAGLLADQAQTIESAYADFTFERRMEEDWCLLIGTRT
ncbi:MAG: 50S ribosomal protein L11 methyltransferase [Gammaproteobacteria bacterium]|nr:50S ribosomal protein L11 methyltransferase [Gammaproteobacteria bacterium]